MSVAVREAAQEWHAAGFSVVPVAEDGSKTPDLRSWRRYQTEAATSDELASWFHGRDRDGLGVVTGFNDLEMFEFENAPVYEAFKAAAAAIDLAGLVDRIERSYLEQAPRGGYHWFWRSPGVAGSTKLASRRGGEVLIETRGKGGFAIVAPSGGTVHPLGKGYRLRYGSPWSVPYIEPEEREALFSLARTFDETPPPSPYARGEEFDGDDRPGDDYNRRQSWASLLEGAGWTPVHELDGRTYWRRPGKAEGVSATTNHAGSDLLWMFSTSTVFKANRSYDKFGAYAFLHHGGDYAAAARALAAEGYGPTPAATARVRFTRYTAAELSKDPEPMQWLVKGLLPRGTYGPLAGERKTLKSWTSLAIAVGVAAGKPVLGQFAVPEAQPVAYYAGEGGRHLFQRRLRRVAESYGVAVADLPLVAYFDVAPLDSPAFGDSLAAVLDDVSPGLVIVDPLYAFHGTDTKASDLYARGTLLSAASAPVAAAGSTLLINDHFNKTGSGGDLGRISQAGVGEWADSWLLLSHRTDPDVEGGQFRLRLDVGSRQWGGRTFDLDLSLGAFDDETGEHEGRLTYALAASDPNAGRASKEAAALGRAEDALLDVLRDQPFMHTKTDAFRAAGVKDATARKAWDLLVSQRLIVSEVQHAEDTTGRKRARDVWAAAMPGESRVRMGVTTDRPHDGTARDGG